jgi:outer membrane receptor for ferrienterochelin and colicin
MLASGARIHLGGREDVRNGQKTKEAAASRAANASSGSFTILIGRSDEGQHRESDEHGSDFGLEERAKVSEVAAAIFVITLEDIARSGATNIPDLLRMVPGMDVAQINSNTWAISARGFNFQFASKLLVLIDGRAVYTPLLAV